MWTHWLHEMNKEPHISLNYQTLHINGFRHKRFNIRFKFLHSYPVVPEAITQVLYSGHAVEHLCYCHQWVYLFPKTLNRKWQGQNQFKSGCRDKKRNNSEGSKTWQRCSGGKNRKSKALTLIFKKPLFKWLFYRESLEQMAYSSYISASAFIWEENDAKTLKAQSLKHNIIKGTDKQVMKS